MFKWLKKFFKRKYDAEQYIIYIVDFATIIPRDDYDEYKVAENIFSKNPYKYRKEFGTEEEARQFFGILRDMSSCGEANIAKKSILKLNSDYDTDVVRIDGFNKGDLSKLFKDDTIKELEDMLEEEDIGVDIQKDDLVRIRCVPSFNSEDYLEMSKYINNIVHIMDRIVNDDNSISYKILEDNGKHLWNEDSFSIWYKRGIQGVDVIEIGDVVNIVDDDNHGLYTISNIIFGDTYMIYECDDIQLDKFNILNFYKCNILVPRKNENKESVDPKLFEKIIKDNSTSYINHSSGISRGVWIKNWIKKGKDKRGEWFVYNDGKRNRKKYIYRMKPLISKRYGKYVFVKSLEKYHGINYLNKMIEYNQFGRNELIRKIEYGKYKGKEFISYDAYLQLASRVDGMFKFKKEEK